MPENNDHARSATDRVADQLAMMRKSHFSKSRYLLLALKQERFEPMETKEFVLTPRRPFRPVFLIPAHFVGSHFMIDDIKVGSRSQFASGDGIPLMSFMNRRDEPIPLDCDLAEGMSITIKVSSIRDFAERFEATLVGVDE